VYLPRPLVAAPISNFISFVTITLSHVQYVETIKKRFYPRKSSPKL
jgi:hypothetical protein